MNKTQIHIILLFTLLGISNCTMHESEILAKPTLNLETLVPKIDGLYEISLESDWTNKFILKFFGSDYSENVSYTVFYSSKDLGDQITSDISEKLTEGNWQVITDWTHENALLISNWKKGEYDMTILVFDDLDEVGIEGLKTNYGITGLIPGNSLVVMHMIDQGEIRTDETIHPDDEN